MRSEDLLSSPGHGWPGLSGMLGNTATYRPDHLPSLYEGVPAIITARRITNAKATVSSISTMDTKDVKKQTEQTVYLVYLSYENDVIFL